MFNENDFLALGRTNFTLLAKLIVISEDKESYPIEDRFIGDMGADLLSISNSNLIIYQVYFPEKDEPNIKRQENLRKKLSSDSRKIYINKECFKTYFNHFPRKVIFIFPDNPDINTLKTVNTISEKYEFDIHLWSGTVLFSIYLKYPHLYNFLPVISQAYSNIASTNKETNTSIDILLKSGQYQTAAEIIELSIISQKNYTKTYLNNIETLAICKQKIGDVKFALSLIEKYYTITNNISPLLLVCKGKCISQLLKPLDLKDYYEFLNNSLNKNELKSLLSSISWRLSLISNNFSDAKYYLKIHKSIASDDYQIAHNQQCESILGLLRKDSNIERNIKGLYASYILYKKSKPHGLFSNIELTKCILSNIILFAIADKAAGKNLLAYKKLFFTRILLKQLGITVQMEAMKEIGYLLKETDPEVYEIIFNPIQNINFIGNSKNSRMIQIAVDEISELIPNSPVWPSFENIYESFILDSLQ